MTELTLRSLLHPAHYFLATKLPLPEADREQWCMRLDSMVRSQNEFEQRLVPVRAWHALPHPTRDLLVDGMEYTGQQASNLVEALLKRARNSTHEMLSIAALLVLDERASINRSTNPVTCDVSGTVVPPADQSKRPVLQDAVEQA